MRQGNPNRNRRLQNRVAEVLPVRVRGIDQEGQQFEEIALQTVNQEYESWGLKPSDFEVDIPSSGCTSLSSA